MRLRAIWDERKLGSDQKADGQKHLNNIMFFHIHKNAMDEINLEHVASEFVQHTDGRNFTSVYRAFKVLLLLHICQQVQWRSLLCVVCKIATLARCACKTFFFTQLLRIFSLECNRNGRMFHKSCIPQKIDGKFDVHNFL